MWQGVTKDMASHSPALFIAYFLDTYKAFQAPLISMCNRLAEAPLPVGFAASSPEG